MLEVLAEFAELVALVAEAVAEVAAAFLLDKAAVALAAAWASGASQEEPL